MHTTHRRLPGELVFSIVLIVFSLFMLWTAYGISKFESITSAGSFPMFAAAVLLISGMVAARQTFKSSPIPGEAGESVPQQFVRLITPAMLVQFVIAIAVYMVALEPVGFVVSSYLFLVISMWLLGSRKIFLNVWVSALVLACIYGVFQTIFAVVLPSGTLLQGLLK